ncbi:hypothetical protein [Mesomycoplasma lagogenitalium]|uniref:Uncharacterized protein n=1 Tax=Mesomycoplasma lagogenitalium TaxID=171286 RepID=A0ABY8LSP7_9BACT|nr:hypothetical protein [Mesomycoplasma lagogenitalium]WGI36280.1 hypothetical protein QEG99_02255 [Mesomycoplasma lagogenitalium]
MIKKTGKKIKVSEKEALKTLDKYENVEWSIEEKEGESCIVMAYANQLKTQETSEKKITLKSLYNLVLNMQNVLLDVQKQTNENSADIKKINNRLDRVEAIQEKQAQDINKIKDILAEHNKILQEHSKDIKEIKKVQAEHSQDIKEIKEIQAEHSKILQEHSQDIKEIKEDVKMLKSFHEDDIKKYKNKK